MTSVPVEEIDSFAELDGIFDDVIGKFESRSYATPLEGFQETLRETHSQHFSGRRNPTGEAWPALAASTIARKGHDIPLVETGRLRASVLELNHPDHLGGVSERGLVFGTDVEYGIFHQDGTRRIPQREFVGMNEETFQVMADGVADHAVDGLRVDTPRD